MANPQKSAIDSYLEQLGELIGKRGELNKRISQLERVVRGMVDLLDTEEEQIEYLQQLYDVIPPEGLTAAIQQVLQSEKRAFTPTEVRDRVKSYLLSHSNPMASVHTVLKRLVKTEWVVAITKEGKTFYKYADSGEQWSRAMERHMLKTIPNSLLGREGRAGSREDTLAYLARLRKEHGRK